MQRELSASKPPARFIDMHQIGADNIPPLGVHGHYYLGHYLLHYCCPIDLLGYAPQVMFPGIVGPQVGLSRWRIGTRNSKYGGYELGTTNLVSSYFEEFWFQSLFLGFLIFATLSFKCNFV